MRPATTKFLPTASITAWRDCRVLRGEKRIVFTNGCFDLIHAGHIQLLEQARSRGDLLIVGVNTDESVRALKGDNRPINKFNDRIFVLAGLEAVDWVTPLQAMRATELILLVQPTVWVKGGDYTLDSLDANERLAAQECNSEIVLIPFVSDHSTSDTIQQIKISS